jgi:hypothetical protein
MIRTQISFEPDLYRQAQREAARLGISLAELCRRSLRRGLGAAGTPENSPWLRYTGSISGGRVDESSKANIDSVVYGEKAHR